MIRHVLPLLAATAATPLRADQRAGESFARRRMRQRRPMPIIAAVLVAVALLSCEQGPGSNTSKPGSSSYSSKTFTINQVDFVIKDVASTNAVTGSSATIEYLMPSVTAEAIREGMIAAYLTGPAESATSWAQLPLTFSLMAQGTPVIGTVSYRFRSGKAVVFISGNFNAADMQLVVSEFHQWRFRVVVGTDGSR